MSLKTIHESRAVHVLAGGADKSARLADVRGSDTVRSPEQPMACEKPTSVWLRGLADTEAAAKLKGSK